MTDSDQRQLLNCGASGRVIFEYRCPLTWDALTETDDPRQRGCQGCRRTVYWCSNLADATVRAVQGECIAVPRWVAEGVRAGAEREAADKRRIIIGMVGGVEREADLLRGAVEARTGPVDWRHR